MRSRESDEKVREENPGQENSLEKTGKIVVNVMGVRIKMNVARWVFVFFRAQVHATQGEWEDRYISPGL